MFELMLRLLLLTAGGKKKAISLTGEEPENKRQK